MSRIVVGLDIGTSFIRAVIGEITPEKGVEIIGVAKRPSQGLRNGVIVNIDAAVSVIREAIADAELMAGVEVSSVYTAIGGSQVEGLNTQGQVGVDQSGRRRPLAIDENTKNRVIEAAKQMPISQDKKLLHVIPQEYIIDGQPGYENPLGYMGVRLEVKVHLVSASVTTYAHIEQCVIRSGYLLDGVMLKTLAASYAAVHEDEMGLGSILIDLGGGTTDVMVYSKGATVFTASIPVGGNLVTNDIAIVKQISNATAEKIKLEYGCCWINGNEMDEEVIIPGLGGRAPEQTNRYELCQIIQPRMEEIFTMVRKEIVHKSNLKELMGNIILIGGGALMPGVVELAQSVWGTENVRIGEVADLGGADSSYRGADFATAVGLVVANKDEVAPNSRHRRSKESKKDSSSDSWWKRFKESFF